MSFKWCAHLRTIATFSTARLQQELEEIEGIETIESNFLIFRLVSLVHQDNRALPRCM